VAAAGHAQHLLDATSPYLQDHASGDIDWRTWGDAALKRARKEDRPVLLMLGRAGEPRHLELERGFLAEDDMAPVIAHEYVPVLVDRDERPDLADLLALQARLDGEPSAEEIEGTLVAILTPEMRPLLVRPASPDVAGYLLRFALEYRAHRADADERAAIRLAALEAAQTPEAPAAPLSAQTTRAALTAAVEGFDRERGTFAQRPARLPLAALRLGLAEAERAGRQDALSFATRALEALARSGVHDHVGGGFFHKTADPDYNLPRFEKRLADNALLLDAFVRAHALTGKRLLREAACGIADWAREAMRDAGGTFAFAEYWEGAGGEAREPSWNEAGLREALGASPAERFLRAYRLAPTGVLSLVADDAAALAPQLARLREARARRVPPTRDRRVFAGANGLMIAALARSGAILDRPGDVAAARAAAEGVLDRLGRPKDLRRLALGPSLGGPAMLDDHAGLLLGLVELQAVTREARYRRLAVNLAVEGVRRFHDPQGGFFLTDELHAPVLVRVKTGYDGELPAANALMAEALVRLAEVTHTRRPRRRAEETVRSFLGDLERVPRGSLGMAAAAARLLGQRGMSAVSPPSAEVREDRGPLTIAATLSSSGARPGESLDARVRLEIARPWSLVAPSERGHNLAGLTVGVLTPGFNMQPPSYPQARIDRPGWSPDAVSVFTGQASFVVPIRVGRRVAAGETTVRLRLRFQLCDRSACSPPDSALLDLPFAVMPSQ
jgi:uncharacterized protein YyaL (SSP411 family)